MASYFHKMNSKVLQFDCKADYQKVIFNHYIMRKRNLNNIKGELAKDQFLISIRSTAKDLNISSSMANNLIKTFEKLNIIELVRNGSKNHNYSIYKYMTTIDDKKTLLKTVIKADLKTVEYSDINELDDRYKTVEKTDSEIDTKTTNIDILNKNINIYKSVVEYLNTKTNKNFKPNTNKTITTIDARVNEGFKIEDFYRVIDIKSKQWLNTEMERFLRPATLFSNKFEGYLNEEQIKQQDTSSIKEWEVNFEF
ncbi:MAG: conserved phage C-terminal domain-containing protein [Romboutsia sp.]